VWALAPSGQFCWRPGASGLRRPAGRLWVGALPPTLSPRLLAYWSNLWLNPTRALAARSLPRCLGRPVCAPKSASTYRLRGALSWRKIDAGVEGPSRGRRRTAPLESGHRGKRPFLWRVSRPKMPAPPAPTTLRDRTGSKGPPAGGHERHEGAPEQLCRRKLSNGPGASKPPSTPRQHPLGHRPAQAGARRGQALRCQKLSRSRELRQTNLAERQRPS